MGRRSTVATHPQRARIESMLDDGVSYADIVRSVGGTSIASVGRFALSRKSELAKLADDEPGITSVLSRLIEVADHAQQIRRQTKIAGSPVAQSRAIKSETEVLGKLLGELAVDDTSIAQYVESVAALVAGIKRFAREHPTSAADLIRVLGEKPDTAELAAALKAQMEKNR